MIKNKAFGYIKYMTLILVLILNSFSSSCSAKYMSPQPLQDQKISYKQGMPAILSSKSNLVQASLITDNFNSENNPRVLITVGNRSSNSFDFSDKNIKAVKLGEKGNWQEVKVYSYDEVMKRIRKQETWAAIGLGMQAAGNSIRANQPSTSYSSGAYSGSSYNNNNKLQSTKYNGTYHSKTVTYDPGSQEIAAAINRQELNNQAQVYSNHYAFKRKSAQLLLRQTTLFPGSAASGYIELNGGSLWSGDQLSLYIELPDETHKFVFTIEHR